MAIYDPCYDYDALAKGFARQLPKQCTWLDWEDIRQQMVLEMIEHESFPAGKWGAQMLIRHAWAKKHYRRDIDFSGSRNVRQDIICEAYHIIQKWPWLYDLMAMESGEEVARKLGINRSSVSQRVRKIRRKLLFLG